MSLATTQMVESAHCDPIDAAVLLDGSPHPLPGFDGCDTWAVDRDTLLRPGEADGGGKAYEFVSDKAYVTGGVLYASFEGMLSLPVGSIVLTPSKTIIVATLELSAADGGTVSDAGDPDGTGLIRIENGLIQGRLGAAAFLSSLSVVGDPLQHDSGICPTSPSFAAVQAAVCNQLDVASRGPDDNSVACDGFSFASTFDAVSAHVGDVIEGGTRVANCPPGPAATCP